jgi:hypothetical protein
MLLLLIKFKHERQMLRQLWKRQQRRLLKRQQLWKQQQKQLWKQRLDEKQMHYEKLRQLWKQQQRRLLKQKQLWKQQQMRHEKQLLNGHETLIWTLICEKHDGYVWYMPLYTISRKNFLDAF